MFMEKRKQLTGKMMKNKNSWIPALSHIFVYTAKKMLCLVAEKGSIREINII